MPVQLAVERQFFFLAIFWVALVPVSQAGERGDTGNCTPGEPGCLMDNLAMPHHYRPPEKKDVSHVRLVRRDPVKVGHEETVDLGSRTVTVKTLSVQPPIFEIPDFLTMAECNHLIRLVEESDDMEDNFILLPQSSEQIVLMDRDMDLKLSSSEMAETLWQFTRTTFDEDDLQEMYRHFGLDTNLDGYISQPELGQIQPFDLMVYAESLARKQPTKRSIWNRAAWLFANQGKDDVMKEIDARVMKLTSLPDVLVARSDVEVVHYPAEGGYYSSHMDSQDRGTAQEPCCQRLFQKDCRACRFATLKFYLNDVAAGGETAFPVADSPEKSEQHARLDLRTNCSSSALRVSPRRGKALLWYNHKVAPENGWLGRLEDGAWHGECPTLTWDKWLAHMYISVTEDKDMDLELEKWNVLTDGSLPWHGA